MYEHSILQLPAWTTLSREDLLSGILLLALLAFSVLTMTRWDSKMRPGRGGRINDRSLALPAMDFSGRGTTAPTFELPDEIQAQLPANVRNRLQAARKASRNTAFPFLKPDDGAPGADKQKQPSLLNVPVAVAVPPTSVSPPPVLPFVRQPLPPRPSPTPSAARESPSVLPASSSRPKSENDVKRTLREFKAPITLFGEGSKDRLRRVGILEAAQKMQSMNITDSDLPSTSRHPSRRHTRTSHSASAERPRPHDSHESSRSLKSALKTTPESSRGRESSAHPQPRPGRSASMYVGTKKEYTPNELPISALHVTRSSKETSSRRSQKHEPIGQSDSDSEEESRHRHRDNSHRSSSDHKKRKSRSSREKSDRRKSESHANRNAGIQSEKDIPPHYRTLGVSRGATQDQIKAVYKELASRLRVRADEAGSEHMREAALKRLLQVEDAYELLRYPTVRAKYDKFYDDPDAGSNLSAEEGSGTKAVALQSGLMTTAFAGGAGTDFYELLCITRDAPGEAIEAAYKEAAGTLRDMRKTAWHPDLKAEASHSLAAIKQAYAVLKDPKLRLQYDKALGEDVSSGDEIDHYAAKFSTAVPKE